MRRVRLVISMSVLVLAVASIPAAAQSLPTRGYVFGFGGLGATQVNSALVGASAGFRLGKGVQITTEASRTNDVLTPFTEEDLAALDSFMGSALGYALKTSIRMPTNYYTAGLRYTLPVGSSVRPYVGAATGVAHVSPVPTFRLSGIDISSEVMQEQIVRSRFGEGTRPVYMFGGGLAVNAAHHLTFDLGYKYSAIVIHTDYLQSASSPHSHTRINAHKVHAGVGVTF